MPTQLGNQGRERSASWLHVMLIGLAFGAAPGIAGDGDDDHFSTGGSSSGYVGGSQSRATGGPSTTLDIPVDAESVAALPDIAGTTPTPAETRAIESAAAEIASLASSNNRIQGFGRLTVVPTIEDHKIVRLRISGLDRNGLPFVITGPIVTRQVLVEIRNIRQPNEQRIYRTRRTFEAHFPGSH